MKPEALLAHISRCFLARQGVYRLHLTKAEDLPDAACIAACHAWCEEQRLTAAFEAFRREMEAPYRHCVYLAEYIEDGLCCDIQMIANGYIHCSALPDLAVDAEKARRCCAGCPGKFV